MDVSIVIPVFNEVENIDSLINETSIALIDLSHEIIVVDDCSIDGTLDLLKSLKKQYSSLRIISHKQNYGQSAAVRSGVEFSNAIWIATLDGDGQNDPADIPNLFKILLDKNKSDNKILIAGHRTTRKDTYLKKISSKYANKIRAKILRDKAPDTGCGLKLFSKNFYLSLPFFDHMHRYIPALFIAHGGEVVSIPVNHRSRVKGSSKYGFHNRFWVGIVDILGVRWLQNRSKIIIKKEI